MEENKLKRFNKIFPWYDGLSGDLLFWVAIDTLFLTVVKNFTASQIVSLTSISMIINILLQVPLLKIIHKIGNTKSVRLGSFLLLISSILLTFGKNYITIVIGKIFYEMAFTFQNMINAVLKNFCGKFVITQASTKFCRRSFLGSASTLFISDGSLMAIINAIYRGKRMISTIPMIRRIVTGQL